MMKKLCLTLMLTGLIATATSGAEDTSALMHVERIGKLRIGSSAADVTKEIHCPLTRGAEQEWGADGTFREEWKANDCGITLSMASEQKGGAKSVQAITVTNPSKLSTQKGIHIGSTIKAVMKAYKATWNKEDSKLPDTFVAGSLYGGLVFTFQKEQVSQIFLGAAAE